MRNRRWSAFDLGQLRLASTRSSGTRAWPLDCTRSNRHANRSGGVVSSSARGCATEYAGRVVTPAAVEEIRRAYPGDPIEVFVPLEMPPDAEAASGARTPEGCAALAAMTPERVTLSLSSEGAPRMVPVGSVQRIVITHHAEGTGIGAGLGIAAGLVAAVLASATYTHPCAHSTSWGCVQAIGKRCGDARGPRCGDSRDAAGRAHRRQRRDAHHVHVWREVARSGQSSRRRTRTSKATTPHCHRATREPFRSRARRRRRSPARPPAKRR